MSEEMIDELLRAHEAGEAADGRKVRGDRTRQAILEQAVQVASAEGLEGLSIGRLAAELGVSKSGLFAHFGSKSDLQVATVQAARRIFVDEVIGRALPDGGIDEVLSLTDAWLAYMEKEVFRGGCFFVAASVEFDSRPGPVRDEIAALLGEWLIALEATVQDAQEAGHLSPDADVQQLAFEIHSLGMGANWAFQLYRDEGAFDRARSGIRARLTAAGAPLEAVEGDRVASTLRLGSGTEPALDEVGDQAARQTLRGQIARLERELSVLFEAARPGDELDWKVGSAGGPRVLDVGDLELLRDNLALRVEEIRKALRERADSQQQTRARLESIVADPGKHKFAHVSNDQVGEPGCKHFRSTPRLGLVGMLMGWWRVKISSGCP